MTELRKAAERALEALEDIFGKEKKDVGAINALRQALNVVAVNISQERVDETRKGEHIKCIVKDCQNHIGQGVFVGNLCKPCHDFLNTGNGVYSQAYRNTKREWVGLTEEEIDVLADEHLVDVQEYIGTGEYISSIDGEVEFARAIEAKLKEKNT